MCAVCLAQPTAMFRRQFQRDLNGLHERLRDAAVVQEETLSLRIASIFIVALVSLLGCVLAVAIRCKEGEDNMTHRLLKCLAGGVIAGVGFVHVLAESAEMLGELSPFPWAHVVAMFGAFLTLLLNQVPHNTTIISSSLCPRAECPCGDWCVGV